jgi:hypothetical protein
MAQQAPEVRAARQIAAQTAEILAQAPSYQHLDAATQAALTRDLRRIQQALNADPLRYASAGEDPYALSLAGPAELARRRREAALRRGQPPAQPTEPDQGAAPRGAQARATETIAGAAGAVLDEIDFPGFVASLVHGTFDAMVDASIRQMEAYASLVSAVAKDVDRFTSENVTANQVRDWLVERYPADVALHFSDGTPRLRARPTSDSEPRTPLWLGDYGLGGEELTDELIEEQLIPLARQQIGEQRLQMLATMVLMGMNRIVVQDGSISAKVRFRAQARDRAQVDYAQSSDPSGVGATWGSRGSYNQASMMVSTVGANVQTDAQIRADLFGEVRINFASETLPLERFADAAQMIWVQRHARQSSGEAPAAQAPLPQTPAQQLPAQPPPVQPPAAQAPPAQTPPAPPAAQRPEEG